jgi:hypothetical protein
VDLGVRGMSAKLITVFECIEVNGTVNFSTKIYRKRAMQHGPQGRRSAEKPERKRYEIGPGSLTVTIK